MHSRNNKKTATFTKLVKLIDSITDWFGMLSGFRLKLKPVLRNTTCFVLTLFQPN